jgi:PTS system mannose-specific IID component
MVVGAMPASLMFVKTPLMIGSGVSVQGIIDQVVPNLIPLGLTFLVFYLLRKNIKTTWLLLGLLLLGFTGSALHIFA